MHCNYRWKFFYKTSINSNKFQCAFLAAWEIFKRYSNYHHVLFNMFSVTVQAVAVATYIWSARNAERESGAEVITEHDYTHTITLNFTHLAYHFGRISSTTCFFKHVVLLIFY